MNDEVTSVWMINARGRVQLVDVEKIGEAKNRGCRQFPINKLLNGRPPQNYYPQYDNSVVTRETKIIYEDELAPILETEVL